MQGRNLLCWVVLCTALAGCARPVQDAEVEAFYVQFRQAVDDFRAYIWENPPPRETGAYVEMSEWVCPIVRPDLLQRMLETGDYPLELWNVADEKHNYYAPAEQVWTFTGNRTNLFSVEKIRIATGEGHCTAHLGSDLAFCC